MILTNFVWIMSSVYCNLLTSRRTIPFWSDLWLKCKVYIYATMYCVFRKHSRKHSSSLGTRWPQTWQQKDQPMRFQYSSKGRHQRRGCCINIMCGTNTATKVIVTLYWQVESAFHLNPHKRQYNDIGKHRLFFVESSSIRVFCPLQFNLWRPDCQSFSYLVIIYKTKAIVELAARTWQGICFVRLWVKY